LYEIPCEGVDVPPQIDKRLMTVFGACWTAGSLKYLSEAGAEAITYYETVGERGIMQGDYPGRWPDSFPAPAGMIFPVLHFFRFLLRHKSYKIIRSISDQPLKTDILAFSKGKKLKALLINLTSEKQAVDTGFCHKPVITYQIAERMPAYVLDTDPAEIINTGTKSSGRLVLPPISITFIDGIIDNHSVKIC